LQAASSEQVIEGGNHIRYVNLPVDIGVSSKKQPFFHGKSQRAAQKERSKKEALHWLFSLSEAQLVPKSELYYKGKEGGTVHFALLKILPKAGDAGLAVAENSFSDLAQLETKRLGLEMLKLYRD